MAYRGNKKAPVYQRLKSDPAGIGNVIDYQR